MGKRHDRLVAEAVTERRVDDMRGMAKECIETT
jgi:hypothetical protein